MGSDPLEDFARVEMEFGTVPSADGAFENYYRLYKPLNFDPSKKYPCFYMFMEVLTVKWLKIPGWAECVCGKC